MFFFFLKSSSYRENSFENQRKKTTDSIHIHTQLPILHVMPSRLDHTESRYGYAEKPTSVVV